MRIVIFSNDDDHENNTTLSLEFSVILLYKPLNTFYMEHTKQMEALNQEALHKLEELIKTKGQAGEEHTEKLHAAKDKWQAAWNEFLETLLVLEKLEI